MTTTVNNPNENDVLFGRGSGAASHSGNSQFRVIVESKKEVYSKASKIGKRIIALSIIEEINNMDPPGRFLMEDPRNKKKGCIGPWVCVDEDRAVSKVTHCLREKRRPLDIEDNVAKSESPFDSSRSLSSTSSPVESPSSNATAPPSTFSVLEKFHETRQIPLREWISLAISSIDVSQCANRSHFSTYGEDVSSWPENVKTSVAVSSEAFLMPALKVAISLADQICGAERIQLDSSSEQIHGSRGTGSFYLPDTGYDWAERTMVRSTFSGGENQITSTPLSDSRGYLQTPDLRGVQTMPKSISPDLSASKKDENENDLHTPIQFSSVSICDAQILPPLQNVSCSRKNIFDDDACRIYSLGLVFFEIFSGGQQHCGIEDPPIFLGNDPLECNHDDSAIDLNSALKILDELGSDDELFGDSLEENNGDFCNGKRNKSRRTWNRTRKSNLGSRKVLKLQQLPYSISTLIENMLTCIDGDFRGDDSYHAMKDVRSDLQLMIDKPSKFLHDLDVDKLSRTGLQLDDSLLGRENEFSALRDSYHRSVLSGDEFAIISGPSGIGKSVLVETKFASFVKSAGGVILTGKFDQLQQTRPFFAIASAFNDYCINLLCEEGSTSAAQLKFELLKTFGRDSQYLVKLIPGLSIILGPSIGNGSEQACVDVQKRIEYLLRRFIEVICNCSMAPVTLFLDDLQWADCASLNIIADLLLTSGSMQQTRNFYFLCCVRDEAFDQNHPFQTMISRVKLFGVRPTVIPLSFMGKDVLNEMVSNILCLSPRYTRPLADIIHHKTKGNPLFVNQLLLSLNKDGLLRFSLGRRKWEWDEEKIQSRGIPDDVASLFTNAIGQLSPDVKSAMSVLSCFGVSTDVILVEALETSLGLKLRESLDVAISEGFVDKRDGKYVFCHDRVQEACYNIVKVEDRGLDHFQYGLALCNYTIANGDDRLLLIAMDQVNRGGPTALADSGQSGLIASLNLRAGNKAIEMSDIASASRLFHHGISFLRENNWRDYYDLSLQLHERSATCFLALGDLSNLEITIKQILDFAHSFEDTLNAIYITICALFNASKLQLVIGKGLSILTQLGECLPESVSDFQKNTLVTDMIVKLNRLSDDELLNYKMMTEHSKIMALKFLAKLEITMILTNHSLYPIVTIKIIEISLLYGMNPLSAVGFVHFGCVMTKIGRFREGYRCVKLGRGLVDRFESKELNGEVMNFSSHVAAFIEPVQSIVDSFLQGYKRSLEAGDLSNAAMNFLFHCISMYWAGSRLDFVKKLLDKGVRFCKQQNHLNYLSSILPLLRTVTELIGNEDNLQVRHTFEEHHLAYATRMFQNMYAAFIFRRYDEMKTHADKYFESNFQHWTVLYSVSCQTFIGGLVAFWICRRSNDSVWADRGFRAMSTLKQWAASSEWNFSDKFYLLEAEYYFSSSQFDNALSSYNKAIACAKQHKFVNDEALANELAGHFLLQSGRQDLAQAYMSRAHEKYLSWGAHNKAAEMNIRSKDEGFPDYLSNDSLSFWDVFAENEKCVRKREYTTQFNI